MPPSAGTYDFAVDPDDPNTSYGVIFRNIGDGSSVLDLGCAYGTLGAVLVERRGCSVTGVDLDEDAVAAARDKGLEAHVADLRTTDLDALLGHRRFDRIIVADVLEHLVEPERLLAQAVSLLAEGGAIVASIPNISHIDVQLMLAGDRWDYVPAGLLDRTHLRFYTLPGIRGMARRCGLRLASVEQVRLPPLGTEIWQQEPPPGCPPRMLRVWETLAGHRNPHLTVYQHVVVMEPGGEPTEDAVVEPAAGTLDVVVTTAPGRITRLRDALYSVAALTHPAVTALVVVRGDDPAYVEEVRALTTHLCGLVDIRILVVPGAPHRRAPALNAGLDAARGDFVCLLDDGDVLYPHFASVLAGELTADPRLSAASGGWVHCRGRMETHGFVAETKEVAPGPSAPLDVLLEPDGVHGGSVMYRRADLDAGRVRADETVEALEDWSLLRRLCRWHEVLSVPEPLAEHRTVDGEERTCAGSEAARRRAQAAICESTAELQVVLTEAELRALVGGVERGHVAALSDELAEARRQLEALRASPVLRIYRALRQTGIHRPVRAAYRLARGRRDG